MCRLQEVGDYVQIYWVREKAKGQSSSILAVEGGNLL